MFYVRYRDCSRRSSFDLGDFYCCSIRKTGEQLWGGAS